MNYRPNKDVLASLEKVILVAVVGPSGSGKTTLVHRAAAQDPSLHIVISDASRARRPEEVDGMDYFFKSKQAMLDAIARQQYVQVAPSNSGDLYATHVASYATKGLALMTIWADAIPVFEQLPFKTMRTIFVVPPSYEVWQARLGQHAFDTELRAKRLAEARRSFAFALAHPEVQVVINDDLDSAATDFIELAHGRRTAKIQHDQTAARAIIQSILRRLPV